MTVDVAVTKVSQEDHMRADLYDFVGKLLFSPADHDLLNLLKNLSGDETELGQAFNTFAKLAKNASVDSVQTEYDALFIGMGRGELLPYASYYLTGFLNEKPLAKLRNAMRDFGIARNDDVKEPEDHIASLMEMMAGLIEGRYGAPASLEEQKQFFEAHIEPWAGHFFKDLEAAEGSLFYQPAGTIGRLFIEIESNAFSME